MQSGISASEELQAQFNSLLSSDSTFGILVSIEQESLVPVASLPSKGSSFESNLASLEPHIKPDVPLYILLRRYDTAPHLLAITYVPDHAKVRQKMLFASTRLTLARELGTEHFRETIFTTEPSELTTAGFQKLEAHNKLDAPLTEEEQTLGAVKRAEQAAGGGTGAREIHLSKNFAMKVSNDAISALKEVGTNGGRTVAMLKIDPTTETVQLVPDSPSPSSITELTKCISDTEPRFTLFRFSHVHQGTESSPVLFFYTCPATPGSKAIRNRMLYPLMKRTVLEVAEKEAGLSIEKKYEVEEPAEIIEQSVLDELHPKATARQGFSRPKRPGR